MFKNQKFSTADPKDKLEHFIDFKVGWEAIVAQKLPLVCFRSGSDEIVGMHFIFVVCRNDKFDEAFLNLVIKL